jgi:hypothetical protein
LYLASIANANDFRKCFGKKKPWGFRALNMQDSCKGDPGFDIIITFRNIDYKCFGKKNPQTWGVWGSRLQELSLLL